MDTEKLTLLYALLSAIEDREWVTARSIAERLIDLDCSSGEQMHTDGTQTFDDVALRLAQRRPTLIVH